MSNRIIRTKKKPTGPLMPPYTEEEVSKFEKENNLTLQPDFRNYLTKISRCVYTSHYPCVVKINDVIIEGSCTTDENFDGLTVKEFYAKLEDPDYVDDDDIDIFAGMIQIGDYGWSSEVDR